LGDNKSCIAYSHNVPVSEMTKHIDLKYHFVKDHVQLGTIKLRYLPTCDMVFEIEIKHSNTSKTGWSLWAPPFAMPYMTYKREVDR
jgi:hypothetical protein